MAKQQVCKKSVSDEAVTFAFTDNGEAVTVHLGQFSPDMQQRFALHGISQKLGDSYSGADGSPEVARSMFNDTLAAVLNGEWTVRGEAGPRVSMLAEALSRAMGIAIEEAVETVNGLDDDAKKKLRAHKAIKAATVAIKQDRLEKEAARADSGDDTDLASIIG